MEMGKRIKELRIAAGLSQEELGERLGLGKSAIAKYENGRVTNIKQTTIKKLSEIFMCKPSYIMGFEDIPDGDNYKVITPSESVTINILGSIPAGTPIECNEDIIGTMDIPKEWTKGNQNYFGLTVQGDSMYPKGDIVAVREQPDCESGQDCIVKVNGYDGTLKKVVKNNNQIILQPLNPEYTPMMFTGAEGEPSLEIVGVVVEIRRKV